MTELVNGRNAIQISALINGLDVPLVMQANEISVTGEAIVVGTAAFDEFVLLNTGQFQGWGDWFDRTSTPGSSGGPRVSCRFSMTAADRLVNLANGALLQFRAEVDSAFDRRIELGCHLK